MSGTLSTTGAPNPWCHTAAANAGAPVECQTTSATHGIAPRKWALMNLQRQHQGVQGGIEFLLTSVGSGEIKGNHADLPK